MSLHPFPAVRTSRRAASFSRRCALTGAWTGAFAAVLTTALAVGWPAPATAQALPPAPEVRSSPGADLAERLPQRPCADLARLARLAARLVELGGAGSRLTATQVRTVQGREACVVDGVLAPAIRFQVALPQQGWTQRTLQVGCGGLCGRISLEVGAADGCVPLRDGRFVLSTTDMGHEGGGGEFGDDPQRRIDFAWRGQHLTAQATQAVVQAFYGQPAAWRYFSGCSDGGREALLSAQRFPGDFDGIVAGAPAMNFVVQNSLHHGWLARANTGADGQPVLLAGRLPVLHRAVLAACDALDGRRDGLIDDPRACRFDPRAAVCAPGVAGRDDCLTEAEAEVARAVYAGPRDPRTGERLVVGALQPGSELNWAGVFVPNSASQRPFSERIALDALQHVLFEPNPKPGFRLADLRFDTDTLQRLAGTRTLYDATNPDLGAFEQRGGKLILWHGWADPHITPLVSIAYHEAVTAQLGRERAQGFARLYLLPGVGHCGGGQGPSAIDLLGPLMDWVERAQAPGALTARPAAEAPPSAFGQPAGGADAAGPMEPGGGAPTRPPAPSPSATSDDPSTARGRRAKAQASPAVPRLIEPTQAAAASANPWWRDWPGGGFFSPYAARER